MKKDLDKSPRFTKPQERRDFLGMVAIGSATVALGTALIGSLRLPMPSLFPESNPRLKIGPVSQFQGVKVTPLPEQRLWVFSTDAGLYAISSVCTHLGCIVSRDESGEFHCPCHGSRFDDKGKVLSGPAPRPLKYWELSLAADGQLVVDKAKEVLPEARLTV